MNKNVPFLMKPPRTPDQVLELIEEHQGMFGVCVLCGSAGHVDQIIEYGEGLNLEVCSECWVKLP
jgi:hypothetical protein